MTARRPLRLAHRGDARQAPENSIAALLAATTIPACDGVEFDVRLSADGVPVLLHDATLARVQGRPERPDQLSADALEALGIPSLEQVLLTLPRHAFLDVELKVEPNRAVVEVLAAGRGAALHDAVVSAFHPAHLKLIAHLAPAWPRWLNTEDLRPETIATAIELDCRGVAADWHAIDAESARRVADAGLDLIAWTVRRRPTFDRLARLGVVGACVEGPALDG